MGLVVNEDGTNAFLKAGNEQAILSAYRELCSFGSGVWCDGTDATAAMADPDGQWLACKVGMSSLLILEKKKIPPHLAEISCLDKALPMKELLLALEDNGEAPWQQDMLMHLVSQRCDGTTYCFNCGALPLILPGQGWLLAPHFGFG